MRHNCHTDPQRYQQSRKVVVPDIEGVMIGTFEGYQTSVLEKASNDSRQKAEQSQDVEIRAQLGGQQLALYVAANLPV